MITPGNWPETAARRLAEEGVRLVALDGAGRVVFSSGERGVVFLLRRLDAGEDLRDLWVADRVIGRAAAFLLAAGAPRAVYAGVLSREARTVLEDAGIPCHWGRLVDRIRDRDGTGFCPLETACLGIPEAGGAIRRIRATLEALKEGMR